MQYKQRNQGHHAYIARTESCLCHWRQRHQWLRDHRTLGPTAKGGMVRLFYKWYLLRHGNRNDNTNRGSIIVTSRRPLPNAWVDPRVQFVAVDFLEPVETIVAKLKNICANVTHAFFTSYVHDDDFKLLRDKNVPLWRNFLDSLDAVCPKLQRVCLQTGGKVSQPPLDVGTS